MGARRYLMTAENAAGFAEVRRLLAGVVGNGR